MDRTTIITVTEPDPSWPHLFAEEKPNLARAFGPHLLAVHHVGSTALHEVAGRPILDVLVEVTALGNLKPMYPIWHKLHWRSCEQVMGVNYLLLMRKPPYLPMHIHLFERATRSFATGYSCRSFKNSPAVCQLYGRLKRKLSVESRGDPVFYERAKRRFLQQAFHKSVFNWVAPEQAPKALGRFLTLDQVAERIWGGYCVYKLTVDRFSSLSQPLVFPGVIAATSKLAEPSFNSILHQVMDEQSAQDWCSYLGKLLAKEQPTLTALISPFDQPASLKQQLLSLGFVHNKTHSFSILPVASFEVFDEQELQFHSIQHAQDLYQWTSPIESSNALEQAHEFYTSLPSKLYGFGEAIEYIIAKKGEQVVAAFGLHHYQDSLGIVELGGGRSDQLLRSIVNLAIQKAHALGYLYIYIKSDESTAQALRSTGATPLFPLQELLYKGEPLL